MVISFCFTIKILNNKSDLNIYVQMIEKSIECAKQYHKVKFYTDEETIKHISIKDVEIQIINTDNFYFVDDFKIHLLDIIKDDEVIIDTDLFLFSPLYLEDGYDLYVDFKDHSGKYWYTEYLNWFVDNGIKEIFPNFNNQIISVPNIGILKFNNKELQKNYTKMYYIIRNWVLSKDENIDRGISIILGQYLLGILMLDYNVKYCYKKKNHYIHLSGPLKFEKDMINNIIPNKTIKII
jgi:hypothetical protein